MKQLYLQLPLMILFIVSLSFSALSQTITTGNPTHNYSIGDPNVTVAPALTISGSGNMTSATVSIPSFQAGDVLDCVNPYELSESFNSTTKTLTLTGNAPIATYQNALRTITFGTTTAIDGSRQIDFTVGAGISLLIDGKEHIYELIDVGESNSISWTAAYSAARASTYDTLRGYLVTITNATENSFLFSKITNNTWIGATDQFAEGTWIWGDGPESNLNFWNGLSGGSAVPSTYNNWASGEPNNSGGEDYAHFLSNGQWNDYPNSLSVRYYIIEYGGFSTSPISLGNSDNAFVNVLVSNDAPVANDDYYNVYENTTRTIPNRGVLINDDDPDGDNNALTVNPTEGIFASGGTVTVNAQGGFSYTPTINHIGNDAFVYKCFDGSAVDVGTCYMTIMIPELNGTGNYNEPGNWNGGYVPPYFDEDMNIVVSGTLNTDGVVNVNTLSISNTGTLNVYHNITINDLTIHTDATINFYNGATITVNNSISNQSRTGMTLNSPVILHSAIEIN